MPVVEIKHLTTYYYNKRVSFGKHRMMLLPRDDGDQKLLHTNLKLDPSPFVSLGRVTSSAITWQLRNSMKRPPSSGL